MGARTDVGSTVATIVVFPVFITVVIAMAQTISWRHQRQMAIAAAQDTATAVALYGADREAVIADTTGWLERGGLQHISITVTAATTITVTVHATATGLLPFTSNTVTVTAAAPTERTTP